MATKKLFRCSRPRCLPKDLGRFESEKPICPQCNLEASDKKFGHLIQRLARIHYDPPTEFPGVGMGHRACDPTRIIQAEDGPGGVPNPWHGGTGALKAVTCPDCMLTVEYLTALEITEGEDSANPTAAAFQRLQNSAV